MFENTTDLMYIKTEERNMIKNKLKRAADFPKIAGTLFAGHFKAKKDVSTHAHPELELILVTRGTCRIHIGSQHEIRAEKGGCFVIPPKHPHDQRGDCDTCFITLKVPEDEIPSEPALLDLSKDSFIRSMFNEIVSLFRQSRDRESSILADALWARLYCHYLQSDSWLSPSAVYTDIAVDYIHLHYMENLGVKELAREAKLSPAHLNRFFRIRYSMSTMQYLYEWRLQVAMNMLKSPYLTVSEIAEACGFSSANYFIRVFRKKYGMTPGNIRKSEIQS